MDSDRSPRPDGDSWRRVAERKDAILNVRAETSRRRGPMGRAIDTLGRWLASPWFFTALAAGHIAWIALNLRWFPGFEPWDPYPFPLLAMIASVEAPFLAILILMRQERERYVDELREEVSLHVNLFIEHKVTALCRQILREERGDLTEELDPERLMEGVEKELEEADETLPGEQERKREKGEKGEKAKRGRESG